MFGHGLSLAFCFALLYLCGLRPLRLCQMQGAKSGVECVGEVCFGGREVTRVVVDGDESTTPLLFGVGCGCGWW